MNLQQIVLSIECLVDECSSQIKAHESEIKEMNKRSSTNSQLVKARHEQCLDTYRWLGERLGALQKHTITQPNYDRIIEFEGRL